MQEKFVQAIAKFYYDMSLAELRKLYSDNITKNISYHDNLYLNLIATHQNEFTPSKIADLLRITRPSVTQKINELVKKGYVVKTQSETDKRVFYLALNDETDKYYKELERIDYKVANVIQEKYSNEELEKFHEILEFISDTYKEMEN